MRVEVVVRCAEGLLTHPGEFEQLESVTGGPAGGE